MALVLQPRATATSSLLGPTPISVATSQAWEGNDGSWSTFVIRVGTPEQVFHVLISTNGQETWIPVPEGCIPSDPSNCGELRGVLPFRNQQGTGFLVNASSTWEPENLYALGNGATLNYTGNGQYGFDTVGLQLPQSGGVSLRHQVVAGIATKDFYLGQFGLGDKPTNFTNFNDPQPSFMWSLRNQSHIPSLSWGYTAGAPYRAKRVDASLTLGGYDASRFVRNDLSFTFSSDDSKYLTLGVQAIQATNTLQGTMSLLPSGVLAVVDSTFPEIWLPIPACTIFERAFGLIYDPHTDRYLVNTTTRDSLLQLNPQVTFSLGNTADGGRTVPILLPYAAFDLIANHPIYPNATRYFPLRRAANDTQYTLGRAFLQEAYIIADYERKNFSISQTTTFTTLPPQQIIPITSLTTPSAIAKPSSTGLPRTTLIGIIVAIVVLLLLSILTIYLLARRRRHKREAAALAKEAEENERRVEAERVARLLEEETNRKHASGMSELMSNRNDEEMRSKYASGASELVGSEQRHELRTIESPIELPASPIFYASSALGSPGAISELGSPGLSDLSELSAGNTNTNTSNPLYHQHTRGSSFGNEKSGNGNGGSYGFGSISESVPGSPRSIQVGESAASPTLTTVTPAAGSGAATATATGTAMGTEMGNSRNPRFVEEGLGIVTSNVEWARGVDEHGRKMHRPSKSDGS